MTVPCGGCVECCKGTAIYLTPAEAEEHPNVPHPFIEGARALPVQADGSCHYLVDGKCQTYETRPFLCRVFDCREVDALEAAAPGYEGAQARLISRGRELLRAKQ